MVLEYIFKLIGYGLGRFWKRFGNILKGFEKVLWGAGDPIHHSRSGATEGVISWGAGDPIHHPGIGEPILRRVY